MISAPFSFSVPSTFPLLICALCVYVQISATLLVLSSLAPTFTFLLPMWIGCPSWGVPYLTGCPSLGVLVKSGCEFLVVVFLCCPAWGGDLLGVSFPCIGWVSCILCTQTTMWPFWMNKFFLPFFGLSLSSFLS